MSYPKLRIMWSVAWGVICLLPITLWIQSYWWVINVQTPIVASRAFQFSCIPGRMWVGLHPIRTQYDQEVGSREFSLSISRLPILTFGLKTHQFLHLTCLSTSLVPARSACDSHAGFLGVGSCAYGRPLDSVASQPSYAATLDNARVGRAGLDRVCDEVFILLGKRQIIWANAIS
jgi:hypothetical protein